MEFLHDEQFKLPIADDISETSTPPSSEFDCIEPEDKGTFRDDFYYFSDVIFLVEDCLFKVPRWYFEQESEVFRTMFQLPVSESSIPDGLSDRQPLRLAGITKHDFRQLLRVMYPRNCRQDETLSLGDWTSVLKLSTMWNLERVRESAIEKMSTIMVDPVDKVALALDYHVDKWFLPALNDLVQRAEPIGVKDAKRLGIDYALKVAALRECCMPMYYGGWDVRSSRGEVTYDFTERIRVEFQL